jgi:hypothetical protein
MGFKSTSAIISVSMALSITVFGESLLAATQRCQTKDAMELMMVAGKISNGLVPASPTSRRDAKKFLRNSTDVMSSTCAVQPYKGRSVYSLVLNTAGIDGGDAVFCESKTTIRRIRSFVSEGYTDSYELRFNGECGQ